MGNTTEAIGLEKTLQNLRIISHDWNNTDRIYNTLVRAREEFHSYIMTDDMWKVYDNIVISIFTIECEDEFDGRIFTNVLNTFGFTDIKVVC